MGFKIRLIDHQETVLITKLIEHRCIGIMTGTDRIEIMLLDHLQIPLHVFDRNHGTSDGIRIMAIHTTEADGVAIEPNLIIRNMDLPQTDLIRNDFIGHFQQERIQIRLFGVPEDRIRNLDLYLMAISAVLNEFRICSGNKLSPIVQQGNLGGNCCAPVGKSDMHRFQIGRGEVIPQAVFRTLQQVYVTENTAGTELILVFQIASVTPLQHQHRQPVCARLQCMGDIKLTGGMGNLTVSNIRSVDPNIEAGINTFKVQIDFGSVLIRCVLKIPQVCTAWIFVRNIRRVCREWIVDVGILMLIVSVILPDTGYRNGIPAFSIKARFIKPLREIVDTVAVEEFPLTIQQLKTV